MPQPAGAPQVGSQGAGAPQAGSQAGAAHPQLGAAPQQDDFLHPPKSFANSPPQLFFGAQQAGAPHDGATASQQGAGAPQAGAHGAGAPQAGSQAGAPQLGAAPQQDDFLQPPNNFDSSPPPQPWLQPVSQLQGSQLVGAHAPQTTDGPQQLPLLQ